MFPPAKPGKHNTEKKVKRLCELSDEVVQWDAIIWIGPGCCNYKHTATVIAYILHDRQRMKEGQEEGDKERVESRKEKIRPLREGWGEKVRCTDTMMLRCQLRSQYEWEEDLRVMM